MNALTTLLAQHTSFEWVMAATAIFLLGITKAGLKGIDILIVTLMALVFEAKPSSGILLPLLCTADILAVIYYRRHVNRKHLLHLLPWMIAGVLAGVWVGNAIDAVVFKKIMAGIILVSVILMILQELRKSEAIPQNRFLAPVLGLAAGFTTMLGNLAGPFANLYFLMMRFDKQAFIGTAAWLFLFINFFKVPFHVWVWHTISPQTLLIDLLLVFALFIGFYVGVKLVKRIRNDHYRLMVIALTLIGAVLILVD